MPRHLIAALTTVAVLVGACGGSTTARLELVSAPAAAETIADTPSVIVLDVRTPEEFAAGHIEGAVNIDFYSPTFRDQLSVLDPGADYVLYCRSGNRSAQTVPILEDLGFGSVEEIDGGILAWQAAGLPLQP